MTDLLINLLSSTDSRLDFTTINDHLFFWNDSKNLAFINEFSNFMETHLDDEKVKKFETAAKDSSAIPSPWSK